MRRMQLTYQEVFTMKLMQSGLAAFMLIGASTAALADEV